MVTENLRQAINSTNIGTGIKELLFTQFDLIDKEVGLLKKEIELLKSLTTKDEGEYYLPETEQERLERTGDGGDNEGFEEWNKNNS